MQQTQNIKHKTKKNVKKSLNPMSVTTKDFIQKICYRRAASVDMTQHGFISDSKTRPVCLLLRPLKDKLRTICENNDDARSRSRNSSPMSLMKCKNNDGTRSRSRNSSPMSLMKCNVSDERQCRKIRKKIHFSPETGTTGSPRTREEKMKKKTAPTTNRAKKARNRSPNVSLMLKTGVIKVKKQKKVKP